MDGSDVKNEGTREMNANELADALDDVVANYIQMIADVDFSEAATMLRQQQAEIEALKQIIDANKLSQNIGQFVKAANEPVAWIDPKELDMDVSTSVTKNKQFESDIPLYVQPQKYCPSENNEAYEKGFIEGMAKQRDSKVQQMVEGYTHPVKEQLTDEEINLLAKAYSTMEGELNALAFARAILRRAQEK